MTNGSKKKVKLLTNGRKGINLTNGRKMVRTFTNDRKGLNL